MTEEKKFPVNGDTDEDKNQQREILQTVIKSLEGKKNNGENLTDEEQERLNKAKDKLKELTSENNNNNSLNPSSHALLMWGVLVLLLLIGGIIIYKKNKKK